MMVLVRKAHAWCGLVLCLLLVPICLSGASLVFKPQWLRASVPGANAIVDVTPAEASAAMSAAERRFGAIRWMIFAGPEIGLHEAALANGGAAYIAPGSHRVRQSWGKNQRAVDVLFDLHHHLLAGETGTKVTGVVGVLALAMAVTGLVIWLPARRSFRGHLTPRRGRAGWLHAHRDLGVVSAPLVAVMTLTGSGLALKEVTTGLLGIASPRPPAASAGPVNWGAALTAAQAGFPEARLRLASPPSKPGAPVLVRLQQPGEWHANGRTVVYLDPPTGRVLAVSDPVASPWQARAYDAFWPVHASKVGGVAWKLMTLLTGVALAVLALYGAESYRRRLFRSRRPISVNVD